MGRPQIANTAFILGNLLLAAAIFVADILLPLGVAVGVLYVALVLLSRVTIHASEKFLQIL